MNAIRKLIEWGQRQRLIPELAQVADAAEAELEELETPLEETNAWATKFEAQRNAAEAKLAEHNRADAELLEAYRQWNEYEGDANDKWVELADALEHWAAAKGGAK